VGGEGKEGGLRGDAGLARRQLSDGLLGLGRTGRVWTHRGGVRTTLVQDRGETLRV